MAHAVTGRDEIALAARRQPALPPAWSRPTSRARASSCATVPLADGRHRPRRRSAARSTARPPAWSCSTPNFFGCLEDVARGRRDRPRRRRAAGRRRRSGEPRACSRPPGALGADIVVGEGQGLGVPLSFGGPYLGVFAASSELVRQMPGRLVGATVDRRRPARLRAHAADARAAHPPREGDVEHLHQRGAVRADGDHLPGHRWASAGSCSVGELSTAKAHYAAERLAAVPGRVAALRRAVLQGVRAAAARSRPSAWSTRLAKDRHPGRRCRSRRFDRELERLPARRGDREAHARTRSTPTRPRWPRRWREAA